MKKGQYHKAVGGYFGAVYTGKGWARFDCDGCMMAAGIVHPRDRLQGPPTKKCEYEIRYGKVVYRHDQELHAQWLKDGKPITAKRATG